ncbi:hypothetical protein [Polyangium sp. 15x6]|uniref:hypothetical protein n=1 Tax=Polyangium sp. 15x6 TaxID=3042687 RepID=UPI00249A97F1|nr:hypothetical protein [Polyangium sp. 15x6]MDI3286832.1 hypothetical protein [Polyangium sp. 15x6]
MLKIYEVVLAMAGDAASIAERIERKDSDLARQMRRAMHSVALNAAEAVGSSRLKNANVSKQLTFPSALTSRMASSLTFRQTH